MPRRQRQGACLVPRCGAATRLQLLTVALALRLQMLFLIRETLIVHWGKDSEHRQSLLDSRAAYKAKKQAAQNGHASNGTKKAQ